MQTQSCWEVVKMDTSLDDKVIIEDNASHGQK